MKNHKVKVNTYWRKPYKIYQYKTRWQVFCHKVKVFFKVLFWSMIVASILVGIFEAGRYINPAKVYTTQEVIKEVNAKAPILDKIAQAESHKSHYCTQELVKSNMCRKSEIGQVLARSNNDKYKSIDVGYYQINLYYWGDKATARGLNLFDEKDNKAMGEWIFQNYGSEPWNSSGKNW